MVHSVTYWNCLGFTKICIWFPCLFSYRKDKERNPEVTATALGVVAAIALGTRTVTPIIIPYNRFIVDVAILTPKHI